MGNLEDAVDENERLVRRIVAEILRLTQQIEGTLAELEADGQQGDNGEGSDEEGE